MSIEFALRTWYKPEHDVPHDEQMNQAILQLQSEAGEVAALWAKHLYKPGHQLEWGDVIDELGDVWYYVRIICHLCNITIEELTEYNREKLHGGHGWQDSHLKIHERLNDG